MNAFNVPVRPLNWMQGTSAAIGAVACFHLAYMPAPTVLLRFFSFGYVIGLTQLARLRTRRMSFYGALLAGLLCVGPQLLWFWNIFGLVAISFWTILAVWIALFVLIEHEVLGRFGPVWAAACVPVVWTGLEYFRSELYYLKFSWMNVGYAFSGTPFPFNVFGMYGAGIIAAVAAALFLLLPRWKLTVAGIAGLLAFGLFSWRTQFEPAPQAPPLNIAGVQIEFPMELEIPSVLDQLLVKYPNAEVLVLSEYTLDGPVPPALKTWCKKSGRYLVVGGKAPAQNGNYYNTAFVVGPEGEIVFHQSKSVPIQFFKDGLPAPSQQVWDSPWGKIGICICYDLSYTRVTDRLVRMGAQILIVPTMDVADWGRRQHEQHALVAPVRAAEYGIPIFRVASSGISQAVSSTGRVLAQAGFPGERETLAASFSLGSSGTLPWDRKIAPLCSAAVLLVVIALIFSRRNRKDNFEASSASQIAGSARGLGTLHDASRSSVAAAVAQRHGVRRPSAALQWQCHECDGIHRTA